MRAKINNYTFKLLGVTYEEYIDWCDDNNKLDWKQSTLVDFYTRIKDECIVRDKKTGKLINKNRKEK